MKLNKKIAVLAFCMGLMGYTFSASAKDLCGRVMCEGKGLADVVVTDGFDCVQTDAEGYYRLESKRGVRFVYLTMPAGYTVACKDGTIPQFYQTVDPKNYKDSYDFQIMKNPKDDNHHVFTVQADVQVVTEDNIKDYQNGVVADMNKYMSKYRKKHDVFSLDCGDIVGDSPHLYPSYIKAASDLDMPIYRAIGNHDMTHGGRTYEYSYSTFEDYFGPVYYSFNKGKAHYIVLDNCFYVNRDYQYIGYIDERTFSWMDQDLALVPKDHVVFVLAHIPACLTKDIKWNALIPNETSNVAALHSILKDYDAHIITGHTHFHLNVCFNDKLMEHNTAAVCGIWWRADICVDGTPVGYSVFDVDGNDVKWLYKSAGYEDDFQFKAYPVGSSKEYPNDIIANVWNYDDLWKVEWYENGKLSGEMTKFEGYDPYASVICADKERVKYDWVSPMMNEHMFRATPKDVNAKIEIRVTDRFGRVYKQKIKK